MNLSRYPPWLVRRVRELAPYNAIEDIAYQLRVGKESVSEIIGGRNKGFRTKSGLESARRNGKLHQPTMQQRRRGGRNTAKSRHERTRRGPKTKEGRARVAEATRRRMLAMTPEERRELSMRAHAARRRS